jgi:hypothetical protein
MRGHVVLVVCLLALCSVQASLLDGIVQDKAKNVAGAQSSLRDEVDKDESPAEARPALLSGIGGIKDHKVAKDTHADDNDSDDQNNGIPSHDSEDNELEPKDREQEPKDHADDHKPEDHKPEQEPEVNNVADKPLDNMGSQGSSGNSDFDVKKNELEPEVNNVADKSLDNTGSQGSSGNSDLVDVREIKRNEQEPTEVLILFVISSQK